jgi:glutamyl-tRNA synthetase
VTTTGRLAPSPTGALHLGNARSFLVAWLSARARGGAVILRMEDLDHPKIKRGAARQALEDLRWLGLDWDEGPDVGGPHAPYVQTARTALYAEALERLSAAGRVYPCTCSRRDVETAQSAPHAGDDGPRYSGACRAQAGRTYGEAAALLAPPRLPAWRFAVAPDGGPTRFVDGFCGPQEQDVAAVVGDFVLARHAGGAGYMLAVVVDDAAMGVTEVVRGDDLLATTHRQLLLYRALGLTPPAFTHVPLVVGENGLRLAKRHGDTRLASLRAAGVSADCVVGLLAWWCGWVEWGTRVMPRDLLTAFTLATIPRSPAVLDARVRDYLGIQAT